MAYSYMWMKLDKSDNADCRSRFLYVSRFWVLRAIYEGLIPSVMVLGFVLFAKCQTIVVCPALGKGHGFKIVMLGLAKNIGITWLYNYILFLVILSLMLLVGYLLAKEAKRCVETQIREVVVAYYNFFCRYCSSKYYRNLTVNKVCRYDHCSKRDSRTLE